MSAIAARDGIRQLISDNPIMLTVMRMAVVDNLLGQEKAVGEFAEVGRHCCRISPDPGRLQHPQSSHVGPKAASDFYVIAPWHADIRLNDVLREDGGAEWRVGIVSASKMSGQAFAVKAPLDWTGGQGSILLIATNSAASGGAGGAGAGTGSANATGNNVAAPGGRGANGGNGDGAIWRLWNSVPLDGAGVVS